MIADELRALGGPNEALFYVRPDQQRARSASADGPQLRHQQPAGLPICATNPRHRVDRAIGIGKGSLTVEDLEHADLIVIAGQNPGTNHPRMLSILEKAKANGAKIIAVNPLPEAGLIRFKDPQKVNGVVGHGIPIADEFVQIRLGGDMALFAGLGRLLLEADDASPGTVVDRDTPRTAPTSTVRIAHPGDRHRHRAGGHRHRSGALDLVAKMMAASSTRVLGWVDAAPPCGPDDVRDRQSAVVVMISKPGADPVSCASAFQRAGGGRSGRWASGSGCPRN